MLNKLDIMRIAAGLALLATLAGCGGDPFGPLSGGSLSAPVSKTAFTNWADIAAVDTVFLETNPQDPYSVQTWVVSVDDQLFIPTSLILGDSVPTEREWVRNVEAASAVRVQINGQLYPMEAEKLEDPALHQRVLEAFADKYAGELPEIDEHALNAWIYRLDARD